MNSKIRKIIVYVVFLGLAVVIMYFLYRDISWERDIKPSLAHLKWPLLVLSFALGYLATIIRGLRWNILLEPMQYRADNWTAIHSVAFGYCMNNIVPRSGELARCTLLNRAEKIPLNKLIGTVILERVVDLTILLILLLSAFILNADALNNLLAKTGGGNSNTIWLVVSAIALFILLFALFLRLFRRNNMVKKIIVFIRGIGEGLKSIFRLKRQGLFWLLSFGIWVTWILMTFSVMRALHDTEMMTLADTVFFIGAGSIGMLVPTPGGAGAFHGMSVLGFQALGYSGEVGKVFALISWSGKTAFDMVMGAIGFFVVTSKKIKL